MGSVEESTSSLVSRVLMGVFGRRDQATGQSSRDCTRHPPFTVVVSCMLSEVVVGVQSKMMILRDSHTCTLGRSRSRRHVDDLEVRPRSQLGG
jgi:hypothetical protein